jgi:2-phosphosulfolactate phosphatase
MIDVAFTPAELRPASVAVVVDVLRATSTVTQALSSGYARILCADSIDGARALRSPARVLAGERRCVKPTDFDQGNSPREVLQCRGADLVLATTNGAPATVAAARHAPRVLLASLLNLDAVIEVLAAHGDWTRLDLQIACSGTDGAVALEDVYVAGRLCSRLRGLRSDAALVAQAVGQAFGTPFDALAASADARALTKLGMADDIAFCALESQLEAVPVVTAGGDGVAVITRYDPGREWPSLSCGGLTVVRRPRPRWLARGR